MASDREAGLYPGERFNSISHLIGAVAALVGGVVLVAVAAREANGWKLTSFSVYGLSLLALYTISTLYHSLRGRAKALLRRLDHQAIYLLIAGTYTPFTLVTLRGPWGWSLFAVIWTLAVTGVALEWLRRRTSRAWSLVIYLGMGWLMLIALEPLLERFPMAGFGWLLAGGLCYSLGLIFYGLGPRLRHAHGIWHLFTLAGSTAHYLAVLLYVG